MRCDRRRFLAGTAATGLLTMVPGRVVALAVEPADARLNAAFEEIFKAELARSPEQQTRLGLRYDLGAWDDRSDAAQAEEERIRKADLARLEREFGDAPLTPDARLSLDVFRFQSAREGAAHQWRLNRYALSHLFSPHTNLPAFLITSHQVRSRADAEAYIQRLRTLPLVLLQVEDAVRVRADRGVLPPRFSLEKVPADARTVITGAPFGGSGYSPLLADIEGKIEALGLPAAEAAELQAAAKAALLEGVKPAFEGFVALATEMLGRATDDDGVWKLPDGADYYRHTIAANTTLDLDPDALHRFGLDEVRRIHGEVDAIRHQVGFDGDLKAFLTHLRDDPRFKFSNDDAGRAEYLRQAHGYIDTMRGRLDAMFNTKPKADMEIRRVEAFRERSSARAFYSGPSEDGSRPGVYFINLFNMEEHRTHGVETLAYHEGIPGHHMQIAIAQELTGVPRFRRFGGYSAYSEGWALYTEKMVKSFGAFTDPYSDYGRLEGELFRSIRLVVDTGIHAKRWTRAQAIDFMVSNSAIPTPRATREIDRYIVNPGQALAYKVGMRAIEDLRAEAERALGPRFDLRDFHDAVLLGGPLPLPILERRVRGWVDAKRA